MGKVYLAQAGGLYKIGCSENPQERVKKLQAGCPLPITLVHTIETPRPRETEAALQRRFCQKKELGEWYRLNEADVAQVKGETAPHPVATPLAPPRSAGPATGALTALHDLWRFRWYLLAVFLLSVPLLIGLESYRNQSLALPSYQLPTITALAQAAPTAQLVRPTAVPVIVPPVEAPVPVIVQAVPTPVELLPINDATATALGAPAQPALVAPTAFAWPVTWPVPTVDPVQAFGEQAETTLAEAGYQPVPALTMVIPRGLVGH